MLDINFVNLFDREKLSESQKIELSKFISSTKKDTKVDLEQCAICGKKTTSFCKSHSIPEFVLKNIASKGKVIVGSDFASPTKDEHGLKNTLLFSCICHKCDNTFFQEYEDPSAYNGKVNDLIINEIAIKTYLKHYFKRLNEKKLWEFLITLNDNNPSLRYFELNQRFQNKLLTINLDINDVTKRINRCIKKKKEKLFYLIDEIDLPYQVKIAYQGAVALSNGFDGVVNELYNYDPRYRIEQLHICIFPNKGKTKILLFCEDGLTRIRHFYKPYKKLDLKSKLYLINYILMLYDEEWCIPSDFDKNKLNEETLRLIGQITDFSVSTSSIAEFEEYGSILVQSKQKELYKLQTSGNVYNYLEQDLLNNDREDN